MNKNITIPKKNNKGIGRSGHEEKIIILNDNDEEVEVILFDEDPQNVIHPRGNKITWLAHFKVNGLLKYTIQVNGIDNFVFWDGGEPQIGQNWTTREMTGDPAIGRD
jgi:hypothetical protein